MRYAVRRIAVQKHELRQCKQLPTLFAIDHVHFENLSKKKKKKEDINQFVQNKKRKRDINLTVKEQKLFMHHPSYRMLAIGCFVLSDSTRV